MKFTAQDNTLYLPDKTPRGWYVLFQPGYRIPNVFNLHEKGMFKTRPAVEIDHGARIVVREGLQVAVQYMQLADEHTVDPVTGESFSCMNKHGLVLLDQRLDLDTAALDSEVTHKAVGEEIKRIHNEWYSSLIAGKGDVEPDMEGVKGALQACVDRGRKSRREWLINNNMGWIRPVLPRMMHDVRYGVYERAGEKLYEEYRQGGGEDQENGLIRKITLFARICESEGLLKPTGARWLSEEEVWDCWEAFSGSESEAKRVCTAMEKVLIPLKQELEEEPARQEK